MISRVSLVAALLASPIALVAPALAQEDVSMKLRFEAGQELPYSLAMVVNINQRMGEEAQGQESIDAITYHVLTKIKINEVATDGSLKATLTFDKVAVEAVLGSDERGYTWPNEIPLPDSATPTQKLGTLFSGAKIALEVDAKGEVVVTSGFEELSDAYAKADNPDPRLVGFFEPEKFADVVEPIFRLDDAPAAPRSIEKGWQNMHQVDMPPVGAMSFISDWMVMNIEPDVVRYIARVSVNMLQPSEKPANVPTVTLKPSSGATVESFYDRGKQLLRRRKVTTGLQTTWELGPTRIEQTQSTSVTVVLLDENVNMKMAPTRKF